MLLVLMSASLVVRSVTHAKPQQTNVQVAIADLH